MRKAAIICTMCVVILTTGFLQAKTKVSLKQAFDKKIIKAKAVCKGGLELNYSVTNLLKDSLLIVIPAGWRFNSDAGKKDYQDILVAHEEVLALRAMETKNFEVKGYCCEATKGGPVAGAPYTPGKLADSSLVQLARYLNANKADKNAEQYSVWAISDHKETANITSANDSLAALLRAFVAGIKGEPLPWYTLLKRARVTAMGDVQDQPVRFKADITYAVSKTCYSFCYIVDDKGNKVSGIFGTWLQPENTDYKASFNVAGLKKGEYRLILENKDSTLFEREFKI
jgi:hypothetical protein